MIHFLTMPDDPEALSAWLDGQLLQPHLPQLVAELRLLHPTRSTTNLTAVLGEHRRALLERGCTVLPRAIFTQLLQHPELLLELVPLIYAEGGPFWFTTPHADQARADRIAEQVQARIAAEQVRPASRRRPWKLIASVLSIAAALVLGLYLGGLGQPTPEVATAWGFAKIEQLPPDAKPSAIYEELARMAEEWNKRDATTSIALTKRLTEFRQGCAALQLAKLPLPAEEQRWLKARCTDWAAAADAALRQLEESGDVNNVRNTMNTHMQSIAAELRQRAATV